ncbi:MAG: hypothetical protein HON23_05860 [Rickettsiales bacterium]|jgi:hypothetical protein|nr:hypothetical protein [Rickettsiales bacterium]
MKKVLKAFLTFILLIITTFVVLVFFSSSTTRYKCAGNIGDESLNVFMEIEKYSWFVLWGDSDAVIYIEIPNRFVNYYHHVIDLGHQMQIYESDPISLQGNFSQLSNTLALKTHYGFFDGVCSKVE